MTVFDSAMLSLIFLSVITGVLFYFFVLRTLGLPFVPSRDKTVNEIFSLLGDVKGKKVLDLGSGNGKIVIAAAKRGAHAVGFEINPLLVWLSRKKIACGKYTGTVHIQLADFWSTDVGAYDIIIFYGIVPAMKRLEHKLMNELKPGAQIVTSYCEFPGWKHISKIGHTFLYVISL